MSDEAPASPPQTASSPPTALWTPAQRGVLIAFVLILSTVLLVRAYRWRTYVSDPQPPQGARAAELADRLDPNVATWQELAVLPQIGEKRAREIVAFREQYVARLPDRRAFERPEDLLKVKGIGAAMLETMRPHLMFPTATQPATRAADL